MFYKLSSHVGPAVKYRTEMVYILIWWSVLNDWYVTNSDCCVFILSFLSDLQETEFKVRK
jgi:hypothetical protein